MPPAVIERAPEARLGIVYFGTTRYAIEEARDQLSVAGVNLDLLRVRALPLGPEVAGFVAEHDDLLVIEMNRDNQLRNVLRAELPDHAARIAGAGYLDGMPLTAEWVATTVMNHLNGKVN